jgi:hypothetical protein
MEEGHRLTLNKITIIKTFNPHKKNIFSVKTDSGQHLFYSPNIIKQSTLHKLIRFLAIYINICNAVNLV